MDYGLKEKHTFYYLKTPIFELKVLKKMNDFISIDYPEFLANSMRLNKNDFGKEIKISALVKLFELGKVSSGTAAKALQISRIEFLELLSTYKVEFIHHENLAEDLENA